MLKTVVGQCEVVGSHWSHIEQWCARLPRTLIHGDFAPKNMRVRNERAPIALLPFDWGSAGWGVPAADLAQAGGASWHYWASPDLSAYRFAVGESWPHLGARDLQALAAVGKVFRCLVCIDLDARSLATEWVEHAARNMRVYRAELADALQAAGWERGAGR